MPTFDQYLAESGQQSKLDELRRTGQYDQARSQFERSGSYGSSQSSGGSSNNFDDILKRTQQMAQQANAPIINQLQSSIPQVQQQIATQKSSLEAKKKPLQDRYQNLISELKGNQTTSENRQTVTTNNELGKRGLLPASGLAQQELTNALNPITQEYTAKIKDTGLAGEQALQQVDEQIAGLGSQEIDQIRQIQALIAQTQAQTNQGAIASAQDLLKFQAQQEEAARQAEQQAKAFDFQQQQYSEITRPESLLQQQAMRLANSKTSSAVNPNAALAQFLNKGSQPAQSQSNGFTGALSALANIPSQLLPANMRGLFGGGQKAAPQRPSLSSFMR